MDPVNMPAKFEVRSFTRSWDNMGTPKIWGVPGFANPPYSAKFLRAFVRMDPVNIPAKFEFVALPVPKIIGGTQKIWAVPVYSHAPFSPKFLIGFCSHGPSEYICQVWRS